MIVDDGIATGPPPGGMPGPPRARGARAGLAVPIGPDDIVARFAGYADEVVCLEGPAYFFAVGRVTAIHPDLDDEVVALLDRARRNFAEAAAIDAAADPPLRDGGSPGARRAGDTGQTPDKSPRTRGASWFSHMAAEGAGTVPAIASSPRS